jgi:predicted nucleotidyltransferase
MVASIKSHNKGESMKMGNNAVSGKVPPNLKIANEKLQDILNKIEKHILDKDLYIALGVGGSYSTGENVDIYSDLDLFLIVDAPEKDFQTIIKQISNLFKEDIFVIERGDVKYLGYVYNVIFSSLTYLDLFINNKTTFEPCYLTNHMKILIDKDANF